MKKLYIGNLAVGTTSDDLSTMCGEFGQVANAKMAVDRETGQNRAFGFVEMNEGAEAAIKGLNNREFKGRNLKVNEAMPKDARPKTEGYSGGTKGGVNKA